MNDDDRSVWDYIGIFIFVYGLFYLIGLLIKWAIILFYWLIKLLIELIQFIYRKVRTWIKSRSSGRKAKRMTVKKIIEQHVDSGELTGGMAAEVWSDNTVIASLYGYEVDEVYIRDPEDDINSYDILDMPVKKYKLMDKGTYIAEYGGIADWYFDDDEKILMIMIDPKSLKSP